MSPFSTRLYYIDCVLTMLLPGPHRLAPRVRRVPVRARPRTAGTSALSYVSNAEHCPVTSTRAPPAVPPRRHRARRV